MFMLYMIKVIFSNNIWIFIFREELHYGIPSYFYATGLSTDMGESSGACILVLLPCASSQFLIQKMKIENSDGIPCPRFCL